MTATTPTAELVAPHLDEGWYRLIDHTVRATAERRGDREVLVIRRDRHVLATVRQVGDDPLVRELVVTRYGRRWASDLRRLARNPVAHREAYARYYQRCARCGRRCRPENLVAGLGPGCR